MCNFLSIYFTTFFYLFAGPIQEGIQEREIEFPCELIRENAVKCFVTFS